VLETGGNKLLRHTASGKRWRDAKEEKVKPLARTYGQVAPVFRIKLP
jgi:hypothetical protein